MPAGNPYVLKFSPFLFALVYISVIPTVFLIWKRENDGEEIILRKKS